MTVCGMTGILPFFLNKLMYVNTFLDFKIWDKWEDSLQKSVICIIDNRKITFIDCNSYRVTLFPFMTVLKCNLAYTKFV